MLATMQSAPPLHLIERSLPQDETAERALLGAILLDREAIIPIADHVQPEHFYIEKHAWIYAAAQSCYKQRIPPDLTTIADALRRHERLEMIGGVPFLIDLSNCSPYGGSHVEYYAQIVLSAAECRGLIRVGGQIAALGYDESLDASERKERAEKLLFGATQASIQRPYITIGQAVDQFYSEFDVLVSTGSASYIPTRFLDLNHKLNGGFFAPDFNIVAARPGVGKTSWMLNAADDIAAYFQKMCNDQQVGIFSIEMDRKQLLQRQIAIDTGIDAGRFRRGGRFAQDEIQQVVDAMGRIQGLPIVLDDTPGITLAELRSKARKMVFEQGVAILFIDYLGKIKGNIKHQDNRVQEVGEIARGLKDLARELHIPVICLAQLNRASENRSDQRPKLADLRDSGEIEQEADSVLFLYRDCMVNKKSDKQNVAEVIIEKNRFGPLGTVELRFDARTTRFDNLIDCYSSIEGY